MTSEEGDLLKQLLAMKRTERIGHKGGAAEILKHDYFRKYTPEVRKAYREGTKKAPWIPLRAGPSNVYIELDYDDLLGNAPRKKVKQKHQSRFKQYSMVNISMREKEAKDAVALPIASPPADLPRSILGVEEGFMRTLSASNENEDVASPQQSIAADEGTVAKTSEDQN